MRITPQIFSLGTKDSFVIFYKFLCDRLMAHVSIFCFDDNKIDVGFFFFPIARNSYHGKYIPFKCIVSFSFHISVCQKRAKESVKSSLVLYI